MTKKGPAKDPAELLKQIEEDEREAFRAFQESQKEKREKALAALLEPLRERRSQAAQEVNELNSEISDLDRQIAKLTGKEPKPQHPGQRAKRKSRDEKIKIATLVYGVLKDAKTPKSSGELERMTEGVKMREIAKIWNEENSNASVKIKVTGKKAATRYSV